MKLFKKVWSLLRDPLATKLWTTKVRKSITGSVVRYYRYSTARIPLDKQTKIFDTDGDLKKVETVMKIFSEMGIRFDNHICFETDDGGKFMWTDGRLIVGTEIVEWYSRW